MINSILRMNMPFKLLKSFSMVETLSGSTAFLTVSIFLIVTQEY